MDSISLRVFFFVLKILNVERRNFSLVVCYSLKFTRCLLLVIKSLPTRCKTWSLLLAEDTRCKKTFVARCKTPWNCSLQQITRYPLQNSLVTRCKSSSVTCCKICSMLVATNHSILVAKVANCQNHLSLVKTITSLVKILVFSV